MDFKKNCRCSYPIEPTPALNKIICLLEYELTQNDIGRISEMLYCYIASVQNGFMVVDLPNVMTVLEILSERLKSVPAFGDILKKLLLICQIPTFMTRSSDILTYAIDVREYFSVLGYVLLRVEELEFQKLVLDTINILVTITTKTKNQVTLEQRQKAAVTGRFPKILAHIIFIVNDDLFPQILELTYKLLIQTPEICEGMITEDVFNSLLTRIDDNWRSYYPDKYLYDSSESDTSISNLTMISIIVNLLGVYLYEHEELVPQVPTVSRFSLWNINNVYSYVTTRKKNASARNLLLINVIWILNFFPNIDFISSGLAQGLMSVTTQEVACYTDEIIHTKLPVDENDFIYIKLYMCTIPFYLEIIGGKGILERNRIIYRLLKIISHPSNQIINPKEHACIVKIVSYKILNVLIPHLEDEFIENSGLPILLKNICNRSTSPSGLILLSKCLDTVRQSLKYDPRRVLMNSFLFNNGPEIILDMSREFLNFDIFTFKAQICVQEIFHILSIVYKNGNNVSNVDSIEIAIKFLQRMFEPKPNEPVYDNRIVMAVINFIWEVIVTNEELVEPFFQRNGVYLMLDVLQTYPLAVKILILGALVDLCDFGEGKCIPYLVTWKGKHGVTLLPLLMSIFRYENKELGVKVGPRGEIADSKCPLMGSDQYAATFKKVPEGNPSIADMYASCRPKIYALLSLMYERHRSILDVCIETYKTWDEHLSTEDQITLLVAENFLGLKLGEAWVELKTEFAAMGFEPLPADAHILNSLVMRTHKWGRHIKEVQKDLLKAEIADNVVEEEKTYRKLNDARITEALESIKEAKYLARCTERMFRIAQMYKQIAQVEKSMDDIKYTPCLHRTFMSGARVTPVFNQAVSIIPEQHPPTDCYSLVSSNESKDGLDYQDRHSSAACSGQIRKNLFHI